MAVRNFWIDADIDGRKTSIGTGPRNKDGGFTLRIYQRDEGSITNAGYISGIVSVDGKKLILSGYIGEIAFEHVTKR